MTNEAILIKWFSDAKRPSDAEVSRAIAQAKANGVIPASTLRKNVKVTHNSDAPPSLTIHNGGWVVFCE
jgi:hypothetical protein